jgi:hypothetical protein
MTDRHKMTAEALNAAENAASFKKISDSGPPQSAVILLQTD